jgi:hypothetical protein
VIAALRYSNLSNWAPASAGVVIEGRLRSQPRCGF